MRLVLLMLAAFVWGSACWPCEAPPGPPAERFRTFLGSRCAVVAGRDGWYFLHGELHSYSQGPFWGDDAKSASVATKDQDPLPAILDFNRMLKEKGIALLLVPVPGKISIYPDKLDARFNPEPRLDESQQQFYALLRKEGVIVVDLAPDFLALRKSGVEAFCKQDTHWSPAAVRVAARLIAAQIKALPWWKEAPIRQQKVEIEKAVVEARGDLVGMMYGDVAGAPKGEPPPKEKLAVEQVKIAGAAAESDRQGPVVLAGDSYSLVFHDGNGLPDMPVAQSGLADHLCAELALPVDLVGVLGSGANGSRAILARRRDNLAGKKVVVWCFGAREFTEAFQGWQKIPVIRQP